MLLVSGVALAASALLGIWLGRDRPPSPTIMGGVPPGALRALLGADIDPDRITQTVSPGNATTPYSANTHLASYVSGGQFYSDAIDILPFDGDAGQRVAEVRRLRLAGFAAWWRGPGSPGGPAPRGMSPHYHIVWAGHATRNRSQHQQIVSFLHGLRGLARHRGRPFRTLLTGYRDPSIRPDEIRAVRSRLLRISAGSRLDLASSYEANHVAAQ